MSGHRPSMSGAGQTSSLGVSTEPGSGNEPASSTGVAAVVGHALVCRLVGAERADQRCIGARCAGWSEDRARSDKRGSGMPRSATSHSGSCGGIT